MLDLDAIQKLGWRQGAILGAELVQAARVCKPVNVLVEDTDWFIVTTHDCDVVNGDLEKEPVVEVLRAEVIERTAPDTMQAGTRNPRVLQLAVEHEGSAAVLRCKVHERWMMPRTLLSNEAPLKFLDDKTRRIVAEWLAKRYIRAAFPTAFDGRWRRKMREWTALLKEQSRWVQGIYLRLNTLEELADETPYRCGLIVAVPVKEKQRAGQDWPCKKEELEREFTSFWDQFRPSIDFDGADILGTEELTLDMIEAYQRFDADWVSFADDSATTPPTVAMAT